MVLTVPRRAVGLAIALLAASLCLAMLGAPASAHTDHKRKQEQQTEQLRAKQRAIAAQASPNSPGTATMHSSMGEVMQQSDDKRAPMSGLERIIDWLGRLHPMIVHFPIAFFPAALFTAIVGRRRPAFAAPVQFLVVAGGMIAPIAAVLGWFDGGFDFASDDALLQSHRWLGTAIGIVALGLAIWAWRRPTENRSPGMIVGLAIISAAIVVQGWFGGALVHGMDHMNW